MLGLKALFTALSRLSASINRSADLFDSANEQLARQLGIDAEVKVLEHATAEPAEGERLVRRNGRK